MADVVVQIATWVVGLATGWVYHSALQRRWCYSVRMKDGTEPIVVRQTRTPDPPNERYQEWNGVEFVDVPIEDRGKWYIEHYVATGNGKD